MTAQEQQMLQGLTDRINNTPLAEKDPDAERFLAQTLGRNADALYILAQTTLVQQYALEQAQKQLGDLKAQMEGMRQQSQQQSQQETKHATSFLGSLFGHGDDAPPPRPMPSQQPPYAPVANYGPPQGGYASNFPPPPPSPGYGQGGFGQQPYGQPAVFGQPQSGGFLRSAMQTAIGVAAGALAFEGIESLMHGFGHSGGGGQGFGDFGGGAGGGRPEEIVNNYYGDSSPHEHSGGGGLGPDVEDRRGDERGFEGAGGDRNDLLGSPGTSTADDTLDDSADDPADTSGDDFSDNSADSTDTSSDFDASSNDDSSGF